MCETHDFWRRLPNHITRDSPPPGSSTAVVTTDRSRGRRGHGLSGFYDDDGFLQIVAKRVGLEEWRRTTVLAVLQKRTGNTLDRMIELVRQHLHVEAYTKAEVIETFYSCTPDIVGVARESVSLRCARVVSGVRNPVGDRKRTQRTQSDAQHGSRRRIFLTPKSVARVRG